MDVLDQILSHIEHAVEIPLSSGGSRDIATFGAFQFVLPLELSFLVTYGLDLVEETPELLDSDFGGHVLCGVSLKPLLDALSVEGMLAREHIELFVEDGL